jgi:mannose-6-phosphate isomerase-like protein (cupin superfamily)
MDRFEVETWYRSPDGKESVAMIFLQGTGEKVCNTASSTYEIVSGRGTFYFPEFGGQQDVEAGDVVHVPSGRVYYDEGDLMMICTTRPAFDPTAVLVLE